MAMSANEIANMLAVDKLVDDLARPIFNLRMARALAESPYKIAEGQRRSGITRATNARREIDLIVNEYVEKTKGEIDEAQDRHRIR